MNKRLEEIQLDWERYSKQEDSSLILTNRIISDVRYLLTLAEAGEKMAQTLYEIGTASYFEVDSLRISQMFQEKATKALAEWERVKNEK